MESLFEFVASSGDGVCAVDRGQKIVFWNEAARDLLGFEFEDVKNRLCYEVLGGSDEAGCAVCRGQCPALEVGERTGVVPTRDVCANAKDGAKVWLNVTTVLVPSRWRDLSVLVHMFRDVTVQKWGEGILEQMLSNMGQLLLSTENGGPQKNSLGQLSRRERDILRMLASGATTHTIAGRLFISHTRVRDQIQEILDKLGVHSRLEAIIVALRSGSV